MKLQSNNGYFQSVEENRRAGANYNVTGPNLGHHIKPVLHTRASIPGQLDKAKKVRVSCSVGTKFLFDILTPMFSSSALFVKSLDPGFYQFCM